MLSSRLYQSSPPDSLLRFKPALSIPLPDGEIISTRIYTESPLDLLSSQATGTDFSLPTTAEFKPAILITLPAGSEIPKVETATPPQQSVVYAACLEMIRAQCADYARITVQQILGVHYKEEERDAILKILMPDIVKIAMRVTGRSGPPEKAEKLLWNIRSFIDENLPIAAAALFGTNWSLKQQKIAAGIDLGVQQALRRAGIPVTPENRDTMTGIIQPVIDAILASDVEETQGQMLDTPEGERQFLEIVVILAAVHTNMITAPDNKSHLMEDR